MTYSDLQHLRIYLHHVPSIVSDAPQITLAPKDKKVLEDGTASFFCKASGNPAPDIHWRKGGRRIIDGRQRYFTIEMPHGSVLRIEPVKYHRDDSAFECVADNGIGEPVTASAQLSIYQEGQRE